MASRHFRKCQNKKFCEDLEVPDSLLAILVSLDEYAIQAHSTKMILANHERDVWQVAWLVVIHSFFRMISYFVHYVFAAGREGALSACSASLPASKQLRKRVMNACEYIYISRRVRFRPHSKCMFLCKQTRLPLFCAMFQPFFIDGLEASIPRTFF